MRILITGGAGFIGSHLVDTYLANGYTVGVIDYKPQAQAKTYLPQSIPYFEVDVRKKDQVATVFESFKPEIVNHHAALVHVANSMASPSEDASTNVFGTLLLLELGRRYSIKQFIFPSSVAVYGETTHFPTNEEQPKQPQSFYGLSKYTAEHYIRLFQSEFRTTIFRYANVYGERQTSSAEGGVVAIFVQTLANHQPPTIYGDGQQTRDFIYVKDIAQANLLAVRGKVTGLMNLSTQSETSVEQLFQTLASLMKVEVKPHFAQSRLGDVYRSLLSNQKAKQDLNWLPQFALEKGLTETITWFTKK